MKLSPKQIAVLLVIYEEDPIPVIVGGEIDGRKIPWPKWSHASTLRCLLADGLVKRQTLGTTRLIQIYWLTEEGRRAAGEEAFAAAIAAKGLRG